MINEVTVISRRKLGSNRVLDHKAVLSRLKESCFRQPVGSVQLEWIRVLPWLQVLTGGELHNCLLDR